MLRFFFKRFFLYFIPLALLAYGNHEINFDFSNQSGQRISQTISLCIGTLLTVIWFPIIIERQKKRLKFQSKVIKKVIRNFRNVLNQNLSHFFNKSDLYLNIRIFLPQKGFKACVAKKIKHRICFEIHNFDGLYVDEIDDLTFQVQPKPQGLVGKCYNDKKLVHDFNLKENQEDPIYDLKKSQIQKTDFCQFAIAVPIINNDESIDAIITFDSRIKIDDPSDETWEELIKNACKTIHLCKQIINFKNINYDES
jgi:hypothetical protein